MLDKTHDADARSWVPSANAEGTDFPIQNLPYCAFTRGNGRSYLGVGLGDRIVDLSHCAERGLLDDVPEAARNALCHTTLNAFMAEGKAAWRALRHTLFELFREGGAAGEEARGQARETLVAQTSVTLVMPVDVGDFTDFECSHHHAVRMRQLMRGEPKRLENGYYLPRAYHGRSSSVVLSGEPILLPSGQIEDGDGIPVYKPSERLDYELELGILIGTGNERGRPIPVGQALDHVFGFCILNDWSARDIQRWESPTLGPFNAKNHQTSISPWIVSVDALAPFRGPQEWHVEGRPDQPLPHLDCAVDRACGALDVSMDVYISTESMRSGGYAPYCTSRNTFLDASWTVSQMIAHHTSGGCNLRSGDLLGSGTISGKEDHASACLMELTAFGADPVALPSGEARGFLRVGDEVVIKAASTKPAYPRIGFGECRGLVRSALGS